MSQGQGTRKVFLLSTDQVRMREQPPVSSGWLVTNTSGRSARPCAVRRALTASWAFLRVCSSNSCFSSALTWGASARITDGFFLYNSGKQKGNEGGVCSDLRTSFAPGPGRALTLWWDPILLRAGSLKPPLTVPLRRTRSPSSVMASSWPAAATWQGARARRGEGGLLCKQQGCRHGGLWQAQGWRWASGVTRASTAV